ncbi:MAG: hypothetical protein JWO02_1031 [Solirubrobacterales bacterium]|nr:hypothetical protein [Solirubrobacterales bacterium]
MVGMRKVRVAVSAALALGAGASGAAFATRASGSASNPKYSGFVVNTPVGYSAEAKARTSSLSRVRFRWDSGVAVKFGASRAARSYGGYQLSVNNHTLAGFLRLPAGKGTGSIKLTSEAQPNLPYASLAVVVGTGTHPTVVITGFPAGTTEVQMSTGDAGSAGTRVSAACKQHLKRWRGSMLITLASGAHENGLVDNGCACGLLGKKSS